MTFWVAGAAVVGAGIGAYSSSNASRTQANATNRAIQAQTDQANQARADTAQNRAAGNWAVQQLLGGAAAYTPSQTQDNFDSAAYYRANPDVARAGVDAWTHYAKNGQREGRQFTYTPEARAAMAGGSGPGELTTLNAPIDASSVTQDPGYQFGLQQGQLALDRKAAAGGGRVSGAALKSAAEYATNYATSGYGAAYQRKYQAGQDRLNRLQQLAGLGQVATSTGIQAGANSTNAISGLISGQGNASAAGQIAQGNIWGNAANQIGAVGKKWADAQTPQNVPMYQQSFTTVSD